MYFAVVHTTMYPNAWKVEPCRIFKDCNDPCNYFPTQAEAQAECDRRNKEVKAQLDALDYELLGD